MKELIMGARLALAGGREGKTRAALTAIGVGLGVAMLLVAASIPTMLQARQERGAARDDLRYGAERPARSDRTMLIASVDTHYRDIDIRGRALQPDGPHAPTPPGVAKLPGPGEMVVSPALADLLKSPEGALLKPRLDHRIVGIIGDEGLSGPSEYVFYVGSDQLSDNDGGLAYRTGSFGGSSTGEGLGPVLLLLVIIIFVVLLLPIAVFIAAAVRFGSDNRDRRLAALRLVGADSRMARRIAAGEALLSAVLGVAVGLVLFGLGRQLVELVTLWDISVFASDVRPSLPLAALIVIAVPAAAVAVTLLALRRIVIEPLGVVRRSGGSRRRVWWRLLPTAVGLALLSPLLRGVNDAASINEYQLAGGAALLLIGVTALLPWLVEAVVRRLRGGSVPWQLATRRLQLDGASSARLVSGIAVAAAGAIALQMLFAGVADADAKATGQDPTRAQVLLDLSAVAKEQAGTLTATLRETPGVRPVLSLTEFTLTDTRSLSSPDDYRTVTSLVVGDCAALRDLAEVAGCADGDTFVLRDPSTSAKDAARMPAPGQTVAIRGDGDSVAATGVRWTVPASARIITARPDPSGMVHGGVFVTPKAIAGVIKAGRQQAPRITVYLQLDPAQLDAVEHVRNAAARVDQLINISVLRASSHSRKFANIQRGLFIGAVATLALIGASLLVSMLEQLRERRRLLAALVAFGTRRSTLSWSLLWQSALPMLLGLILAFVTGAGLGAGLLRMVGEPVRFYWLSVAGICGAAAAVVLLVTALSLPALWRLTRPDGLRAE